MSMKVVLAGLVLASVSLGACGGPTYEVWVDNGDAARYWIVLGDPGDDVTYDFLVPPLTRAIVLQSIGQIPGQLTVLDSSCR